MTKEELIKLINGHEWNNVEFKKAQRGVPESAYETVSSFSNTGGGWLVFGIRDYNGHYEVTGEVTPPVKRLIDLLGEKRKLGAWAIREALGLKDRTHVRNTYIVPALEAELIEYTIPEKPNSRLQKYRLTDRGKEWVKQNQAEK
jgi:hypothetical protein